MKPVTMWTTPGDEKEQSGRKKTIIKSLCVVEPSLSHQTSLEPRKRVDAELVDDLPFVLCGGGRLPPCTFAREGDVHMVPKSKCVVARVR